MSVCFSLTHTYIYICTIVFLELCGFEQFAAKSLQSCPTLCNPIDGSPPGSTNPGILQARTLEWVAISFSNAWKWKVKVKSLSCIRLLATPWTAAYQAPPSIGFSRQEYWSGVPLPSPLNSLPEIEFFSPVHWESWNCVVSKLPFGSVSLGFDSVLSLLLR